MSAVDALSRAINLTLKAKTTFEPEVQACVDLLVKSVPVPDERLEQIKLETEKDDSQRMLNEVVIQGSPKHKGSCDFNIRHYWNNRQTWHQHLHKKAKVKAEGIWIGIWPGPANTGLFCFPVHFISQCFSS